MRKKIKPLYFCISAFLFPSFLFSQNAILQGIVSDTITHEHLVGANVIVKNGMGTATDLDGNYALELPAGNYIIEYRYVGYISKNKEIILLPGDTNTINVDLKPDEGILNTVVVTGSKFEKKIGEETVTLDVIKPSFIQNANDVSVDKSVQRIPGVDIINGQANIRGGAGFSYGAGSRVLLLMDDLPLLTGDAAYTNWNFVPIENVQQVEIIKGAASALYGSSALNGIINVRTAYPTSTPETKISFYNGIYTAPSDLNQKWWGNDAPFFTGASFAHRQKFNRFDLVTGGYMYYENSYLQNVYDRFGRLNLNTRYRINKNFAVGININGQVSRSNSFFFWDNIDSGLLIPSPNTLSYNQTFKFTADPFLNYYDKYGNRHKLLLRYYRSYNDNLTNQSSGSDLYYAEYQYQKLLDAWSAVFTVGLVGNITHAKAQLFGDTIYDASNEGAYLQLDKKFFQKLNFSAGMRYEMNQIAGLKEARPVFRFGANYQLAKYTYLRASWGQGYRFPSIAEKYISTSVNFLHVIPNPALKSETGWSSEIGIKQGIKISKWKGYIDISAFMSEYFDMMEFTFGFFPDMGYAFQSQNIGDTKITGAEISITGEGNIGNIPTTIIAGYTYINPLFQNWDSITDASSSADYNILKYRFKNTAKADVESTIKKFRIGIAATYRSYMEAVDAAFVDPVPYLGIYIIPQLQAYRDTHSTGDVVFDARLAYIINKNMEASFLCNNVLNRLYTIRPAYVQPTRTFTVKINWKI